MQPQDAQQLAIGLMDQHGLTPDGWTFGWLNYSRIAGMCYPDEREIRLNLDYVSSNSVEEVRDTVLHEIAHTLTADEEAIHGPRWKKKCEELGASTDVEPLPSLDGFPLERFSSGESNLDNLLDASKHGRCRWCGTAMPKEYPKDGHAFVYRCCSAICQILYAGLPAIHGDEVDFAQAEALLLSDHDVRMHRRRFPTWFRKEGPPVEGYRYCANETSGRHALPRQARANQNYCDRACQQAAHRARKAAQGTE